MTLTEYRTALDKKKGGRAIVLQDIATAQDKINYLQAEVEHTRRAQEIIQAVAETTQKQLEYRISELVSLSMEYVFDDPYTVALNFRPSAGKTVCGLRFKRGGHEASPMDQSGYGAVNIAGFGLRIGCMSLSDPRPRPVLLLDEPFPNLKGAEANARAIQMVKRVSDNLALQVLMVSDERAPLSEIEHGADKVFHVTIDGHGRSSFTEG